MFTHTHTDAHAHSLTLSRVRALTHNLNCKLRHFLWLSSQHSPHLLPFLSLLPSLRSQSFGCGHLYCGECLEEYLKCEIGNGNVRNLRCPNLECDVVGVTSLIKSSAYLTCFDSQYERRQVSGAFAGVQQICWVLRPSRPQGKPKCAVVSR